MSDEKFKQIWIDSADLAFIFCKPGETTKSHTRCSMKPDYEKVWTKLVEASALEKAQAMFEDVKEENKKLYIDRGLLEIERDQLKSKSAKLVEALRNIAEYWNGDYNDQATGDMARFATAKADQALAEFGEGL